MGKSTSEMQVFSPLVREGSVRGKTAGSLERWQRASRSLAGGVSSGLRRSARPYPLYSRMGGEPRLKDVDGNNYLDYCAGLGAEHTRAMRRRRWSTPSQAACAKRPDIWGTARSRI